MEDSDTHGARFHVFDDDSIGADPCVVADYNGPENLRAGTDIDMVANHGQSFDAASVSHCNLLKYKTIYSNLGTRMDNDSIWVRNEEASADVAIQRDIGSRDNAPKSMPKHDPFSEHQS